MALAPTYPWLNIMPKVENYAEFSGSKKIQLEYNINWCKEWLEYYKQLLTLETKKKWPCSIYKKSVMQRMTLFEDDIISYQKELGEVVGEKAID